MYKSCRYKGLKGGAVAMLSVSARASLTPLQFVVALRLRIICPSVVLWIRYKKCQNLQNGMFMLVLRGMVILLKANFEVP